MSKGLKRIISVVLIILMLFCCLWVNGFAAESRVITYDIPAELGNASVAYAAATTAEEKSNLPLARYDKLSVTANGEELFVYATGVAVDHAWADQVGFTLPQRYTPVVIFEFVGSVDMVIDASQMAVLCDDAALSLESFSTATVSPVSRGVVARVDGKRASFTLTQPGDYTVVLGDDERTAIHIFASAPKNYNLGDSPLYIQPGETQLPDGWENASALVFLPGLHRWGTKGIKPKSNQTVCLAGGSVVESHIQIDGGAKNVQIVGCGILDDSQSKSWKIDDGVPNFAPINCCRGTGNITIKDITVLNPSLWMIMINGVDGVNIDNVHLISGKHNGDGISVQSSMNVTVTNSFVRSWDDSLVIKNRSESKENNISSHTIRFSNVTVWNDLAQSMEIGYETNQGNLLVYPKIYDVTFEDITVIYSLHKPVISIHNADNAEIYNVLYKNITVEHANMGKGDAGDNAQLIELSNARPYGGYAATPNRGRIHDITVDGLTVLNTDRTMNTVVIDGADGDSRVENIRLNNISVGSKRLRAVNTKNNRLSLEMNRFTRNIRIDSVRYTLLHRVFNWLLNLLGI